ncbi:TetR family transcriptional regulator, partial [Holdemanella porci]
MTFNEKVTMKDLLSEGLYILMQQKPFEKITIKQICDKTGVIRGTFYNHFMDKYEALEYLIHRMFFKGFENQSNPQIIKHIFQTVSDNRDFFKSCYRITGQNGFEDLMSN